MRADSIRDILIHCIVRECPGLMRIAYRQNIDPAKRTPVYRCQECSVERTLTEAETATLPENGGFKPHFDPSMRIAP